MDSRPLIGVELTDDVVRALVARARELDLLPEPAPDEPEWYTADEAAAYLRVSVATVRNLVSAGRLPRRYEHGHRAVYSRADLDAYRGGIGA